MGDTEKLDLWLFSPDNSALGKPKFITIGWKLSVLLAKKRKNRKCKTNSSFCTKFTQKYLLTNKWGTLVSLGFTRDNFLLVHTISKEIFKSTPVVLVNILKLGWKMHTRSHTWPFRHTRDHDIYVNFSGTICILRIISSSWYHLWSLSPVIGNHSHLSL